MAKLIILVLGVFAAAIGAVNSALYDVELEKMLRECVKEQGTTEEVLRKMSGLNPADVRVVECINACAMKKTGGMTDGKINLEKIYSEMRNATEAKKSHLKECADRAQESTDECEVLSLFMDCTRE